jgi:anti-sigma-K factor RskA
MIETGNDNTENEKTLRAAEYTLGLLTSDEASAVLKNARLYPELQSEIDGWNDRLTRFAEELPDMAPPEAAWAEIKRKLRDSEVSSPIELSAARQVKSTLWENAAFWRRLSFVSVGAAVAASIIAVLAVYQPSLMIAPAQDRLVAALEAAAPGTGAAFVATYDPLRKQMVIVPARVITEAQRVPELWLVTKDKRVISLGVVNSQHAQAVIIPSDLINETGAGAGLVITLEPPGGAPGGVATGPAIAKGELTPI